MKLYGLIGYPLEHSFSRDYFLKKFQKKNMKDTDYRNFSIESIESIIDIFKTENIYGLNITIPYKEKIIKYLDNIDYTAKEIGAVNTIKIYRTNNNISIKGFNTDVYGFEESIISELSKHSNALIIGTGGAAKAAAYVFRKHSINCKFVSRTPRNDNEISYQQIDQNIMNTFSLIINATPIGMYPKTQNLPPLPYQYLKKEHFLFDMIYNPEETLFLSTAKNMGCKVSNGLKMLYSQAEKSWEIWNNNKI